MTTIVVTGGREYADVTAVNTTLDAIDNPILLIHGGAAGADTLCKNWAHRRNVPSRVFAANWRDDGKSAGPKRNDKMMRYAASCASVICVAFPGGVGTRHATACATKQGITIRQIGLYEEHSISR